MRPTATPGAAAVRPKRVFRDACGRTWEVRITPADLELFKDVTGVDLAGAITSGGEPIALFRPAPGFDGHDLLVMLIWGACETQAAERGITAEEFGRTVFVAQKDGPRGPGTRPVFEDDIEWLAARKALEALADLFPETPYGAAVHQNGLGDW